MRVSIRDLCWATAVVLMGLLWIAERTERVLQSEARERGFREFKNLEAKHKEAQRQLVEHERQSQQKLDEFRRSLNEFSAINSAVTN